jgi:thioesterase domain-containing protein
VSWTRRTAKFGITGIDEALVPLSVRANGPNLFAFPPGTGDALGFVQLAMLLMPYRFHGFNFIKAESRLHDYADLLMSVDPDGPYVLFGYSSGGNLAYHVTRELEERGRRVEGVGHHNYMLSHPHLDRNADLILEFLDQIVATPCLRSGERAARRSTAAISPADRARR